jgi:hypothetical protein
LKSAILFTLTWPEGQGFPAETKQQAKLPGASLIRKSKFIIKGNQAEEGN